MKVQALVLVVLALLLVGACAAVAVHRSAAPHVVRVAADDDGWVNGGGAVWAP